MKRNYKINFVFFYTLLSVSYFLSAQNTEFYFQIIHDEPANFYHIKLAEGMAQNSITCITQDAYGQMWFATKEGVVRYDAKNKYYYRHNPKDPNTIGGNFVERIYVAHDSSIWVGTQPAVLSRYNPETDDFTSVLKLEGRRIKAIAQDKHHVFWVTTDKKLYRYDATNDSLKIFHYQNIGLDRLLITRSGKMFITTNETYILEFHPEEETFSKIEILQSDEMKKFRSTASFSLYHLTEDHLGSIWIGTALGFIAKYDVITKKINRYYYIKKSEQKIRTFLTLMFIFEDTQHNLWLGTWFKGLYRISPDRKKIAHFMPDKHNADKISNTIVHSGFQDKAGYLWFGTEFAGINILRKTKKFIIEAFSENKEHSLPGTKLSFVVKDKTGRKWVGSMSDGLYYADKNTPHDYYKHKELSLHKWASTALIDQQQNLWFGMGKNLIKYNPLSKETRIYRHNPDDYNSLPNGNIDCLYQDLDGILWIGTDNGLTRFDEEKNVFNRFSNTADNPRSLSSNYVRSIVADSRNNIWVGTYHGLNKLNKQTGNFTRYLHSYDDQNTISSNIINDLYSLDNNVWIATSGGGLIQYNIENQQFTVFDKDSGLSDNSVKGIEADEHHNLWLTTKHNIVKYDNNTRQFINYDASDGLYKKLYIKNRGLQNLEFVAGFSNKDENGYIYFGGISGITGFHPDSLSVNTFKPPVAIEYFSVNGIKKVIGHNNIYLNSGQNNLKFILTTLNFIQPDKNQYAYKLVGLDTAWHYAGHNSIAEYIQVPPGQYIFQYKGANNDGIWGKVFQTPAIIIAPPYYKTTGFYFSVLFFALIIIAGFVAYRYYLYKKIENQKKKLRYHSSKLKKEDAQRIEAKLNKYLVENKLFLEPDLTLQKLAKVINERPHYVSQVINQLYQKRFHDYINSYRIIEAKKLLITTYLKIEAIAYDSGFNSLSTFNAVFKKETGTTPSKFRKLNQK